MLYRNKRTGEIVEFTERICERNGELSDSDRVYFKHYEIKEHYVFADAWKTQFERIGEGTLSELYHDVQGLNAENK